MGPTSASQNDSTQSHPTDIGQQATSSHNRSQSLPGSPNSFLSMPFTIESSHDQALTESVISPGPIRTVQLQRHSIPGATPRYVITDVERHVVSENFDKGITTKRGRGLLRAKRAGRSHRPKSNSWMYFGLAISTTVVLSAFGVLIYLWIGDNVTWRSIATSNWMTRLTTLMASIVWIGVCSQELVVGVALFCLCTTPSQACLAKQSGYIALRRKRSARSGCCGLFVAVLLALLATGLQFSSTILLTDFEAGLVAGTSDNANDVAYTLSSQALTNVSEAETDYVNSNPVQFPIFAEYSQALSRSNAEIDDTGEVIRALLPLSSTASRTSFASYLGHATLLNSRVICLAPTVENLTYTSTGRSDSPSSPKQQVGGILSTGDTLPDGLQTKGTLPGIISFTCELELAQVDDEWPITLCTPSQQSVVITVASPFVDSIMDDTSAYVLLNHTANSTIPVSASIGSGATGNDTTNQLNVTNSNWDIGNSGAWTNLTYSPQSMFSVQLTLCFVSTGSLDSNIQASGSSDRNEPLIQDDKDHTDLNVSNVMRQLNTSGISASRNILSLKQQHPWGTSDDTTSALMGRSVFTDRNSTYGLCTLCGSFAGEGDAKGIASTLSIIFQQTIRDTGSPSSALQSLFTITASTQYYFRYV